MDRRKALSQIGFSALAGAMLLGCREEDDIASTQCPEEAEAPEPSEDDGLADLLFVQNAFGMRYDGARLTLIDADPKTLFFADRPDEIAGFLAFDELIELVSQGPDSFASSHPNATLMIFGDDSIEQAVMRINARPIKEEESLVYPSLEVITGELPTTGGAVALFIDVIGRPMSPGSIAGVHRRHRRRRRRAVRSPGPP